MEHLAKVFHRSAMVIITRFSTEDVADAYAIFDKDSLSQWSRSTFEKSAMNPLSLVAKEEGAVVAYILLSSVIDELTVEDITVACSHRKKGIGRQLLDASFSLGLENGQKFVFLEVRVSNKPAIELYRAMGFELVGERKHYYEVLHNNQLDQALDNTHHQQITHSNVSSSRENGYIMKKALSALSSN